MRHTLPECEKKAESGRQETIVSFPAILPIEKGVGWATAWTILRRNACFGQRRTHSRIIGIIGKVGYGR
jgi:hypothetical protein